MDRIKQLREELCITQKRLADLLETTQQTIARWEKGHVEPNIKALKDMAVIFGTSVDTLLSETPLTDVSHSKIAETSSQKAFWGHLGVAIPNAEHTQWYPISAHVKTRISHDLTSTRNWMAVTTLNNRVLVMNLENIVRVALLDDDADPPSGDWKLRADEHRGLPLEIYKGMDDYARERDCWDRETSEKFRESVKNSVQELNLGQEDLMDKLHKTTVYQSNGDASSIWFEPKDLQKLLTQAELGTVKKTIRMKDYGNSLENIFNPDLLSIIDMPLIDLIAQDQ